MKNLLSLLLIGTLLVSACAPKTEESATNEAPQEEPAVAEKRASPLQNISGTLSGVEVQMAYGAPSVKGRAVWGELVPFGEVWRTGANEATWVEFGADVKVNQTAVPKGRYALFVIPNGGPETNPTWTVIFNKVWNQWGSYEYKPSEDAARVEVSVKATEQSTEQMNFALEGNSIVFSWEKATFSLSVEAAQ